MAAQAGGSSGQHDLLIVGPGVLGSHLGVLWREAFPGATVTAQTNSDNNHAKYEEWKGLVAVTAAPCTWWQTCITTPTNRSTPHTRTVHQAA
jgi:hypothetical protein